MFYALSPQQFSLCPPPHRYFFSRCALIKLDIASYRITYKNVSIYRTNSIYRPAQTPLIMGVHIIYVPLTLSIQFMHSQGIEPTALALLVPSSELQEHCVIYLVRGWLDSFSKQHLTQVLRWTLLSLISTKIKPERIKIIK